MSDRDLKLLLVGPCPPPHGGISVHVATAHRLLESSGVACRVLDLGAGRDPSGAGNGRWAHRLRQLYRIRRCARAGWTLHLHTNGHNPRSWLTILACGLAARSAPGRVLTLHSGMVPDYLEPAGRVRPIVRRSLARLALGPFQRILCVNPRIRSSVRSLGVEPDKLAVAPAYLQAPPPAADAPRSAEIDAWLEGRRPLLVSALSFRPEYGFGVLLDAVERLAPSHPNLGCLVLGGGPRVVGAEAQARRTVRRRGLEERVLLSGDVPHALCLALMARADLFVRPTFADGDALSVREALALGLPVVATDTGCRPDGIAALPRPGDPADLAGAIESTLESEVDSDRTPTASRRNRTERPSHPGGDLGLARLLRTYREVA